MDGCGFSIEIDASFKLLKCTNLGWFNPEKVLMH